MRLGRFMPLMEFSDQTHDDLPVDSESRIIYSFPRSAWERTWWTLRVLAQVRSTLVSTSRRRASRNCVPTRSVGTSGLNYYLQRPHANGGVETAGDQFSGVVVERKRADRAGMARRVRFRPCARQGSKGESRYRSRRRPADSGRNNEAKESSPVGRAERQPPSPWPYR